MSDYIGLSIGKRILTAKEHKETFWGDGNGLYVLMVVVVTQLDTLIKTYLAVHLGVLYCL